MYALESRGRLLLDRGDPNAAKTQFEQALELAASMGHRRLMASSMAHYACTLARLGAFESSLSAADEALEIVTSIRHKGLEAQVRTSRARCLALAGRREAARTAIDEAMTWAEETQGRRLLGELYILHAQRLADEDPDAARDWLRRAEQAFVDGMSAVQGADLAALAEALAARNR